VFLTSQVLAVAVHNHYKRLQNKRMHRAQEAQQQAQAAMVRKWHTPVYCSLAALGVVAL
jgi:ATP-dependent protease Clp ATPase subunit